MGYTDQTRFTELKRLGMQALANDDIEKSEVVFSNSAKAGDFVYADIVSIFPEYGIYKQYSVTYHSFVCKCKTSSGSTVWVYMSTSQYQTYFDSAVSTNIYMSSAAEKTFSKKRIHGTVKRAEDILEGLSKDTGTYVIEFSEVD